jgi:hypothetical protein
MKSLVFSPKNGVIRITQFAGANVNASSARPEPAIAEDNSVCGDLSDLDRRCTAPLRLSTALLSRLPGGHAV